MQHDDNTLHRFLAAQEPVYDTVLAELRRGRKQGHWMWFIFPQLRGLGRSDMSLRYGIRNRAEARAYLQDATLGPRLVECTARVLAQEGRAASDIFGRPDDLKFRSCMTLFASVAEAESVFSRALSVFFEGRPDPFTHALLEAEDGGG